MADVRANAPIIIKRKKIVKGGGHHGGAWKVAYADFVTAMMAFFMLMWLMNATTEKQRKGLADYFSPTIPINRISGGGAGMFGGDSVFSKDVLPKNGTGNNASAPSPEQKSHGNQGKDAKQQQDIKKALDTRLRGNSGDSVVADELMKHIRTRVTDEGLIIELFDLPDKPLFEKDSTTPTRILVQLVDMIAEVLRISKNPVAVSGFVRAYPIVLRKNPGWDISMGRAREARILLQKGGLDPRRVTRVTGWSDRRPAVKNPMKDRNNRVEITLLRSDLAAMRP